MFGPLGFLESRILAYFQIITQEIITLRRLNFVCKQCDKLANELAVLCHLTSSRHVICFHSAKDCGK